MTEMTVELIVKTKAIRHQPEHSMEHLKALVPIIGRPASEALARATYPLLVNGSMVRDFQFVAQLTITNVNVISPTMKYVGDIPDFAIERIIAARALDVFVAFTIHSNYPLPVVMTTEVPSPSKKLSKVDPVVIGWYSSPHIIASIGKPLTAGFIVDGSIIAMWDMDKEVLVEEVGLESDG